jgi:hypothetical protein
MLAAIEVLLAAAVPMALGLFIALQLRRAFLFRRGATVACALRPKDRRAWQGGVARFDPDALRAYRIVGVGLRPYAELSRAGMALGDRRPPNASERRRLMADPIVVNLQIGSDHVEMALGSETLPGLLAWIEGSPGRSGG